MRRISETNLQTMLPLVVHTVSFQIITYELVGPALHSTPILYFFSSIWTFVRHVAQSMQTPSPPDGSDTSSTFTSSDSVHFNEHNISNPLLDLLFHVQVGAFMEAYFDEVDLVRSALSCHFCS